MARALKILNRLAEADMVFWLMPPLMLLLVIGTVAQRSMGLWPALDMFFGSFVIWAGFIPLPGAYILLGILSINLALKFLLQSQWKWQKSGIILSHMGALILMFGGLVTAIDADEHYMLIAENTETLYAYSYVERDFTIYEDKQLILNLPYDKIKKWDFSALPFEVKIKSWCDHCNILKRFEAKNYNESETYQGMAMHMTLQSAPKEPQPENNLTGFEFEINNSGAEGHYIAFDGMPKPIEFTHDDKNYALMFGKSQIRLPFTIFLKKFTKDNYEGTQMARGYSSDIMIKDGDLEWPTRIEMNKPMRYKGYTFFQSSFENDEKGSISILAVVKNKGWLLPYFGTFIISIGLLLHLIINIRSVRRTP